MSFLIVYFYVHTRTLQYCFISHDCLLFMVPFIWAVKHATQFPIPSPIYSPKNYFCYNNIMPILTSSQLSSPKLSPVSRVQVYVCQIPLYITLKQKCIQIRYPLSRLSSYQMIIPYLPRFSYHHIIHSLVSVIATS